MWVKDRDRKAPVLERSWGRSRESESGHSTSERRRAVDAGIDVLRGVEERGRARGLEREAFRRGCDEIGGRIKFSPLTLIWGLFAPGADALPRAGCVRQARSCPVFTRGHCGGRWGVGPFRGPLLVSGCCWLECCTVVCRKGSRTRPAGIRREQGSPETARRTKLGAQGATCLVQFILCMAERCLKEIP